MYGPTFHFKGDLLPLSFLWRLLTWLYACLYQTQWVESIEFKVTFLDGPSQHTYCSEGFLATCLVGSNIIGQYNWIFTNNAQELTPYRFEFTCDQNRIRKHFLSILRFELGSLRWTASTLANSAKPPLLSILLFLF
jgi:hypothetical protein